MDSEGAVGDSGAHPVDGCRIAGGLNNHVGALADLSKESVRLPDAFAHVPAYSEGDDLGLIRLNWHEIIREDSHRMSINAELLDTFSTSID